eukprot:scaffold136861_cov130-Phaeocystis_antarctica.AAC.1
MGSNVHAGATNEALAAREKLRGSAEGGPLQSNMAAAFATSTPGAAAAPLASLTSTALTFVGAGSSPC